MSLVRLCMRCFVMERASPAFCSYFAYVWQIRRPDRRHLAYIWQTHAAKTSKRTPEVAVFAGDVPYISEMSPYEKQNLPYITQIDRLAWGITQSDFTRVHAASYSRGAVRGFAVEFRTCS